MDRTAFLEARLVVLKAEERARAEALSSVYRGEGYEGSRGLGLALACTLPLDNPSAATRPWEPRELVVHELLRTVEAADRCLADGDPEGRCASPTRS